jgi:hypothetical protein
VDKEILNRLLLTEKDRDERFLSSIVNQENRGDPEALSGNSTQNDKGEDKEKGERDEDSSTSGTLVGQQTILEEIVGKPVRGDRKKTKKKHK